MSDPTLTPETVAEALVAPRLANFEEYNTLAALCRQQHNVLHKVWHDDDVNSQAELDALDALVDATLALMPKGESDGTK